MNRICIFFLLTSYFVSCQLWAVDVTIKRHDESEIKVLSDVNEMTALVRESMDILINQGDIPYLRFIGQYWPRVPVSDEDDFVDFSRAFRGNLRALNEFSGKPIDFHLVEARTYQDRIFMFDVLVYHELEVSFWRYSFYKPKDKWIIMLVAYDRNFKQIFDNAELVPLGASDGTQPSWRSSRLGSR